MIGREIIKYSLKNLWKRRFRSFLTILSIFTGIATIFIFVSFGLGLYSYIGEVASESSADKVVIRSKGIGAPGLDTTFKLTDKDLETIEKTQGVYEAVGVYTKVAEVKKDKKSVYAYLISIDPEKPLVMELSNVGIEKGRSLKKTDSGKVILGYNYKIPGKIFTKAIELNEKIKVQGKELRVVGFMEAVGSPPDDAQIYVLNDEVGDLYPNENLSYGWIVARVDKNNIDLVIDRIEKNLRKERGLEKGKEDFYVQSFRDLIETYSKVLNIVIGFIILIALISVVVSAINTTNTMVTSVLERTKEIGTMKAIGAKNFEIFNLFLFESSFLGFVAGVIGVVLGYSISFTIEQVLKGFGWGFLKPSYTIELFLGCIIFAVLTGAVSGTVPALNAAKIKPADTLRYE